MNKILIPTLFLLGLGVLIYFVTKKQKLNLRNLQKERELQHLEKDELKISDPVKYEMLVKEEEERKNLKREREKLWKNVRIGLLIFLVPHFFFEIYISDISGVTTNNPYLPLGINYGISSLFIRYQIFKKRKSIREPIFYGLGVSMIVFCIRLVLGFLLLG